MRRPSWFRDGQVLVSSAPTCGINKDGLEQFTIDGATGERGDLIDDQLARDVSAARRGDDTPTLRYVDAENVKNGWRAVPTYFDSRYDAAFDQYLRDCHPSWDSASIGELIKLGWVTTRKGHGSPSLDQRVGRVPYIKVSDLRAGLVNINPTNLIPSQLAEQYWRGPSSGLRAFDLLSPERASKNIGDFCVLLPGQEQVVLTREVIVLRTTAKASIDQFFLLWALTLNVVRQQWNRVVFMQTNREDVGDRFREIRIPVPDSPEAAMHASAPFRQYYEGLARSRQELAAYLTLEDKHHFYLNPG